MVNPLINASHNHKDVEVSFLLREVKSKFMFHRDSPGSCSW